AWLFFPTLVVCMTEFGKPSLKNEPTSPLLAKFPVLEVVVPDKMAKPDAVPSPQVSADAGRIATPAIATKIPSFLNVTKVPFCYQHKTGCWFWESGTLGPTRTAWP